MFMLYGCNDQNDQSVLPERGNRQIGPHQIAKSTCYRDSDDRFMSVLIDNPNNR